MAGLIAALLAIALVGFNALVGAVALFQRLGVDAITALEAAAGACLLAPLALGVSFSDGRTPVMLRLRRAFLRLHVLALIASLLAIAFGGVDVPHARQLIASAAPGAAARVFGPEAPASAANPKAAADKPDWAEAAQPARPAASTPPGAAEPPPPADDGAVYQYEADGVIHVVQGLAAVPLQFRDRAKPMGIQAAAPPPAHAAPDDEPAESSAAELAVVSELNRHRRAAGVPEVRVDPALSRGCQLHAEYLAQNYGTPATQGSRQHAEDSGLAGYTDEGAKAAASSNVAFGSAASGVALWMATLYHRTLVLDPRLARVGVGVAEVPRDAPGMPAHAQPGFRLVATVMNVFVRDNRPLSSVVYPADGQGDVPLRFAQEEFPDPIPAGADHAAGFPVSVDFFADDGGPPKITDVRAELVDARGAEVPCYLSTPERPLVDGYGPRTVGLIPERPLQPSSEYRAQIEATVDGERWTRSWTFETAPR